MTYCVAWQHRGTAFLVADAAVTSGRAPSSTYSTFGELHSFDRGVSVEESAFKLFRWPKLALTGAGDANAIRAMVWEIDALLARGYPPFFALVEGRRRITLPSHGTVEAIAATRFLGGVRLFRLSPDGEWKLVHSDMAVHLGSPAPELKSFVNGAIVDARRSEFKPRAQLACVLATCQSLTVHNQLMAQGAGGAFTGLLVDREGTHWQQDMAYLVIDPDQMASPGADLRLTREGLHVSSVIRDDILFLSSPTKKGAVAYVATNKRGVPDGIQARVGAAFDLARQARDNCLYHYVAVISTRWPRTGVLDMSGRSEAPYLKLRITDVGEDRALIIQLESGIAQSLRDESGGHESRVMYFSDEGRRKRAA